MIKLTSLLLPATLLALGACSSEKEDSAPATVAADDNDTAEPVAAPVAMETPHDEDVPHTH